MYAGVVLSYGTYRIQNIIMVNEQQCSFKHARSADRKKNHNNIVTCYNSNNGLQNRFKKNVL
jgi:hypothetical protein